MRGRRRGKRREGVEGRGEPELEELLGSFEGTVGLGRS
jgi:hypothetical protein